VSTEAFSFHSEHTLEALRSLLDTDAALSWRGGDNDLWGPYLVARLPSGTRYRLFVDKGRFVLDISRVKDDDELVAAREFAQTRLLPLLRATDIAPHSGWE
jgi:hypothetical protein